MQNKTGKTPVKGIIVAIVLIAGLLYFTGNLNLQGITTQTTNDNIATLECPGISSVTVTNSPTDKYSSSTATSATFAITARNGEQFGPYPITNGGTYSATPGASYSGLAGNNSASYYSEKYDIPASCTSFTINPKLTAIGNATLTIANTGGITANSASATDSVGAGGTVTPKLDYLAPVKQCTLKNGGYVVVDYDATYWTKWEPADSAVTKENIAIDSSLHHNSSFDTFQAFKVNSNELCDGQELITRLKGTALADPDTSGGSVFIHLLGQNYGIDQYTGEVVGPALYDAQNTALYKSVYRTEYYVS